MRENEIFKNLRDVLLENLDIPDVEVKRAYQPTQQSGDFNPTIYFSLINQNRYGYPQRNDVVDGDVIRHIEKQIYETDIQFTGYVLESPGTVIRSVDLLNEAAYILQSDKGRESLRDREIVIIRLQSIRHLYVTDEQGRFQSSPSFDFTVITSQVKETTSPIVNSTEFNKYRV